MAPVTKIIEVFLRNPTLAWQKGKVFLRSTAGVHLDRALRDGKARPPQVVAVRLTNSCNLNCAMCGQPRDLRVNSPTRVRDRFPLEVWQRLVDEIASFSPTFYLWGGEPLLYQEVADLIEYAKGHGLTVQMNTNGVLLPRLAVDLVNAGLDDLIISIDGPPSVHDRVRGLKGAYRRALEGARIVAAVKRERNLSTPIVRIRTTISWLNVEVISQIEEIAEEFEADSANFNFTWFVDPELGEQHERFMQETFACAAPSWKGFALDVEQVDTEVLQRAVERLRRDPPRVMTTISPDLQDGEVKRYYRDPRETFGHKACLAVWQKTYLLPDGSVTPCPDYPDYIAGNIQEDPLLAIWNGPRYIAWRRELQQRGVFPVCTRCCDLYMTDVGFL